MPGLTLIGDNQATNGTTSATPSLHASTAIGDLVLIPFTRKRGATAVATPSGWTATTQYEVGAGTAGLDNGPMRLGGFWRFIASLTMPAVTISGTGATIGVGAVTWRADTGWTVEVTTTSGTDTSSNATFAATGAAVLPFVKEDWLVITAALTSDTPTYSIDGTTPGGASGATFNNLDSKWNSANTSAGGENFRTQTYTAKCTAGLATTAPSISTAVTGSTATNATGGAIFYRLHPVHLPWHLLGIDGTTAGNSFKLQAALDGAGAVYEQTRAELVAGYYHADSIFPVGDDQEWCRFRVRIDGPTTGGTVYARSELREMQSNGTTEAAWSTASNRHAMKATIRVPSLSVFTKPTIIFGQVHDGSDDLLQACTELNATSGLVEGKLRINGTSSGRPKLDLDFRENEEHTYLIDFDAGVLRFYWDDMIHPVHRTTDISSASAYFKVGVYPNTNETTDDATDVAMVDVKDLRMWHTGMSGDQALPGGPALADSLFLAA